MQVNNCYLLPRDRQLEEPLSYCAICGGELYKGDPAFYDDGQVICCCKDCVTEVAAKYLFPITIGVDD